MVDVTVFTESGGNPMALDTNTPRFAALERLASALSEALTLRREINDELFDGGANSDTRDLMRNLRWICRSEMLNLKSFCHLFSGTKTFMGFHRQFDILLKDANKLLANTEQALCDPSDTSITKSS